MMTEEKKDQIYQAGFNDAWNLACDSLLKEINRRRATAHVDEWTCLDWMCASVKSMKRGKRARKGGDKE